VQELGLSHKEIALTTTHVVANFQRFSLPRQRRSCGFYNTLSARESKLGDLPVPPVSFTSTDNAIRRSLVSIGKCPLVIHLHEMWSPT